MRRQHQHLRVRLPGQGREQSVCLYYGFHVKPCKRSIFQISDESTLGILFSTLWSGLDQGTLPRMGDILLGAVTRATESASRNKERRGVADKCDFGRVFIEARLQCTALNFAAIVGLFSNKWNTSV